MTGEPETIVFVFFGVWIVLGIVSVSFFIGNQNAHLKRKLWRPFLLFVGILFLFFVSLTELPIGVFYFLVPATALSIYLNLKLMKFCTSCGSTMFYPNFSPREGLCTKCGAKLG